MSHNLVIGQPGFYGFLYKTRSPQRVQTSLAEADHYSQMPTVKMLSLGGERLSPHPPPQKKTKKKQKTKTKTKTKKKFWIITSTTIWLCYLYYGVFFSFTDHHQNIISSSLYYPGPLHKFHPNPFITF